MVSPRCSDEGRQPAVYPASRAVARGLPVHRLTAVVHQIGTDTIAVVEPRYAQALEVALGVREARTPGARLLGEAVLAALNAAAGEENLLVIIDDLQALDPSSAVVLSYVARRLARSKVRLIGAARSDDAPLFEGPGIGALRVPPLRHVC